MIDLLAAILGMATVILSAGTMLGALYIITTEIISRSK